VLSEDLAEWEKAGFVTLLGHISDMPTLYAKVDIVALPSYREGLPTGLVEAAAAGLPVIATDVPGCRDVVTHMQTGLLIPPKDATALAAAVQTLCGSTELRQRLGAAARAEALARFDTQKIVAETLALYKA
jgi:glycosyltransferase involved in cell wall biosynthesis